MTNRNEDTQNEPFNALTNRLKPLTLRVPIIQGGMGNISPPELCVAVTRAGGLGQIGAGNLSAQDVHDKIKAVRAKLEPGELFGVNVPISVQPELKQVMQIIVDEQVPVVSLSAGNPKPIVPKLKERGIIVIVVVATVKQALKAQEAGADIIVAEGFEAAGKNSPKETTTMTLIPQIVRAVNTPVVAAGGIGDGHGLLAALSLGAVGVQLGTRLIATKDAHVHEAYQRAIIDATDEDTLIVGRSHGYVTRLLNTPYAQAVQEEERHAFSLERFMEMTDENSHFRGAIQGLLDQGHVNAGQISGAIDDLPSVEELFQRMLTEASDQMATLSKLFQT